MAKAKMEENTSLCLVWSSCGGNSGLFFLMVPTRVIFLLSSYSDRGKEVKKLSHVMTCPWSPSVSSRTTRIPWLTSARSPAALPVQSCSLQAYDIADCPYFQTILRWLFGHILPETAPPFERNKFKCPGLGRTSSRGGGSTYPRFYEMEQIYYHGVLVWKVYHQIAEPC